MALKNYIKTTATTGGDTTITVSGTTYQVFNLQVVASGYELAVVNTKLLGGENGGEIHILVYRNGSVVADSGYSIEAEDIAYIDAKEFYEAGDTVAIYGTAAGITVEMFGDYSVLE